MKDRFDFAITQRANRLRIDAFNVYVQTFGAKKTQCRAAGWQLPMEVLGVAGITTAYPVRVIGEPKTPMNSGTCVPVA